MEILYFAYGSNLCLRRMRGRVPSSKRIGVAVLSGYTLRWHKRGADGSGKCTIAIAPKDPVGVHGILYRFAANEKSQLDLTEELGSGYDEASVTVETAAGLRQATTYLAAHSHIDDRLMPYSWYRDLVIERHLARSLGYDVATFIRSPAELKAIAAFEPSRSGQGGGSASSLYVAFLSAAPDDDLRSRFSDLESDMDHFSFSGREIYCHIQGKVTDSPLFGAGLQKATGDVPTTMRNMTTVRRLVAKLGA